MEHMEPVAISRKEEGRSFIAEDAAPLRIVPATRPGVARYPDAFVGRIAVGTVHDGAYIPPRFLQRADPDVVQDTYVRERDWGAALVADALCAGLGIQSYSHIDIARALMDFGRFPGSTPENADHYNRFAINHPFSVYLSFEEKKAVLEEYYDPISHALDARIRGHLISISVHTYDTRNRSGSVRPQVSLVSRAIGSQGGAEIPVGVFDPLYPEVLGEFTCDRILRDRISLDLEKDGIPVAHNYPYLLPEGSVEVRSQVWFFFAFLKAQFEQQNPGTVDDPTFAAVWEMLLDTNLRSTKSDELRSYLHMYRKAPEDEREFFRAARRAYEAVHAFLHRDHDRIIDQYRFSPERPSSLGIEIRKDLIWAFDRNDQPERPRPEQAWQLGQCLARAITQYLAEDRPQAPKDLLIHPTTGGTES